MGNFNIHTLLLSAHSTHSNEILLEGTLPVSDSLLLMASELGTKAVDGVTLNWMYAQVFL